jgi:hypothetical protein
MALKGHRDKNLAQLLGITSGAISTKFKGITEFSRSDILKIIQCYDLTQEETHNIFFNEK